MGCLTAKRETLPPTCPCASWQGPSPLPQRPADPWRAGGQSPRPAPAPPQGGRFSPAGSGAGLPLRLDLLICGEPSRTGGETQCVSWSRPKGQSLSPDREEFPGRLPVGLLFQQPVEPASSRKPVKVWKTRPAVLPRNSCRPGPKTPWNACWAAAAASRPSLVTRPQRHARFHRPRATTAKGRILRRGPLVMSQRLAAPVAPCAHRLERDADMGIAIGFASLRGKAAEPEIVRRRIANRPFAGSFGQFHQA